MEDNKNIFGCFVSGSSTNYNDSQVIRDLAKSKGKEFRKYIWGDNGISEPLKKLQYEDYGKDVKMVLFQFYVNPIPYLEENLKKSEIYRKREKSMGVPIIVNDENFFEKNEKDRYRFLMESIFDAVKIVEKIVEDKNLDTNMQLLKEDLEKVGNSILTFS